MAPITLSNYYDEGDDDEDDGDENFFILSNHSQAFVQFSMCASKKDNIRKASFTPCSAENRVLLPLCTICTLESIGIKFETFYLKC